MAWLVSIDEEGIPLCVKCGLEVDPCNDGGAIVALVAQYAKEEGVPFLPIGKEAHFHFLPTDSCEGSPSRAQHIEGQPRDTRGYRYSSKMEPLWRRAFREIQFRDR